MRSISLKLIFAFLAIGVISVTVIGLLARSNTRSEFIRFVSDRNQSDLVTDLTNYYGEYGSWNGADVVFIQKGETFAKPMPADGFEVSEPPLILTDPQGYVIVESGAYQIGEHIPADELAYGISIEEGDQIVGLLVPVGVPFEGGPREQEFIQRTNKVFGYSALTAAMIALVLGIMLSRTLTRPLRELTQAARSISEGNLSQQVTVRSRDELGELGHAFNKMSAELSRSVNARRQMTADIAHELRTPLSLILGHAEGVHDGVLEPTRENFEIIREEATRLEHLVDDLRILSLADAGELSIQPQMISPGRLLEEVATRYRYQTQTKNLTLDLDIPASLPDIEVDPGRITQVLTNILDNAMRHTPPGGRITLASLSTPHGITLSVRDSGPGLPPADLDRIFDRFYRADESRARNEGGSGLGLAIAKSIVQAHGGTIRAESEQDKGLAIIITFPADDLEPNQKLNRT